jgi:hypothetical protein
VSFDAAAHDATPLRGPQRGGLIVGGRAGTLRAGARWKECFDPRGIFMRSCLLWLIGVPIPIIIILWLITGHA